MAYRNSPAARPMDPKLEESTPHESRSSERGTYSVPEGTAVNPQMDEAPSPDRGSIKFLLNGVTTNFKETSQHPAQRDGAGRPLRAVVDCSRPRNRKLSRPHASQPDVSPIFLVKHAIVTSPELVPRCATNCDHVGHQQNLGNGTPG